MPFQLPTVRGIQLGQWPRHLLLRPIHSQFVLVFASYILSTNKPKNPMGGGILLPPSWPSCLLCPPPLLMPLPPPPPPSNRPPKNCSASLSAPAPLSSLLNSNKSCNLSLSCCPHRIPTWSSQARIQWGIRRNYRTHYCHPRRSHYATVIFSRIQYALTFAVVVIVRKIRAAMSSPSTHPTSSCPTGGWLN